MGAWGSGIYSNGTALDLKATLTSILRLPLDPDEILDLLPQQEPPLADVDDEDHTDCWFVVADRFHRYGIGHAETLARVRRYVESGRDREMKALLGLPPADLRAREATVRSLLERISAPHSPSSSVAVTPLATWPSMQRNRHGHGRVALGRRSRPGHRHGRA